MPVALEADYLKVIQRLKNEAKDRENIIVNLKVELTQKSGEIDSLKLSTLALNDELVKELRQKEEKIQSLMEELKSAKN